MSVSTPVNKSSAGFGRDDEHGDNFLTSSTGSHHRFSHFDHQLFALGPNTSPDQARRALQAHLAETEKRIQEASKLGTSLVQQRKDLSDRLAEVEKQQGEADITPELRQKLVDIEKEYNEVGRESARAFLPKQRVSSAEMGGSPYAGEKRAPSPIKFESEATNSPSKLSVPNRRQRNQPSNRVHDIEFATEISTSLLSQVRSLQALLAEKDEANKSLTYEKARLEQEAEGFNQRLRSLDESENRYKDENWNLETQIHEHLAAAKEAQDREKRMTQNLNLLHAEKSAAQKELDDIKLSHAKLSDDHVAAIKHHEVELGGVRRSMALTESDRGALQRRVDELISQNNELAKASSGNRGRQEERDQARGLSDEDFETAPDDNTPEHSPPPSPVKGTPRHSMLESETLKSSLHHAHRMIQNLKGNIHREKTEKLELKRMLQDARDEIEARRNDGTLGSGNKRNRKADSKEFKKPLKPGQLGGLRSSRSEVFLEDTNWEEDDNQKSPSHSAAVTAARVAVGAVTGGGIAAATTDSSDHFDTANEGTESAFETANERATETEDFQTGAEDLTDSDEHTETEAGGPSRIKRNKPSALPLGQAGDRRSFQSTASTSGDEYSYEEVKTPTSQPQRMRLKVGRGASRRSRAGTEEPQIEDSPASVANSSTNGTPQPAGQSLFAELGNMSDEDESLQGTPIRSAFSSKPVTPGPFSRPGTSRGTPAPDLAIPPVPRVPMIDSSMMTDPWVPEPATPLTAVADTPASVPGIALAGAGAAVGAALAEAVHDKSPEDKHASTGSVIRRPMSDASSQWHEDLLKPLPQEESGSRPASSTYSDMSSQYDPTIMDEKLAKFPPPPTSRSHTPLAVLATAEPTTNPNAPLSLSTIYSEHVEPTEAASPESPVLPRTPADSRPSTANPPDALRFSSIQSVDVPPISPRSPRRDGVMIPRDESDDEEPAKEESQQTNTGFLGSVFGWNSKKAPAAPVIAEDETRQSPSDSPVVQGPASEQPFKEVSGNTTDRAAKKLRIEMNDESSQTALTSEQIDEMVKARRQGTILAEDGHKTSAWSPPRGGVIIPGALRVRKSQESIGSVRRARAKMTDPDFVHDTVPIKRPGSSGSQRNGSISSVHPPLPTDHKQVIAAAAQQSGPSSSGAGSMGPPSMPASAYAKNPSFRPRTPSNQVGQGQAPLSPTRGGTTPRALHSSGRAEIHSPTGTGRKSRSSSITSFVSEVDTRFNLRAGMMPSDVGTDPRMIHAITQTMIGEYLWKYTRKAGRGALSDNRHRRYFWIHPYTRTLYWSDSDPSTAGRAELKAKSLLIEAVRVVTDDNPMPPGLHRKSLVIMTPGRSVKMTASTGQRHETWFNALSYLLLRAGDDPNPPESNGLTQDDVEDFNPGYGTRRGPPSLSSYNSRTTRNDSPTRNRVSQQPQQASTNSRTSAGGRFSRLSNYWMPESMSSRRSRHSTSGTPANGSIYEASEVHDSAEDLREIIEKQDRESDKLENVRACCDGKHDVGHLHGSTKGRHSHHAAGPSSGVAASSQRSRYSTARRTD